MKYRIVVETEASGVKWYYIQKKFLIYFWRYLRGTGDITMYAHKICWHTLKGAEAHIQSEIDNEYKNSQKKIIKREYINK